MYISLTRSGASIRLRNNAAASMMYRAPSFDGVNAYVRTSQIARIPIPQRVSPHRELNCIVPGLNFCVHTPCSSARFGGKHLLAEKGLVLLFVFVKCAGSVCQNDLSNLSVELEMNLGGDVEPFS